MPATIQLGDIVVDVRQKDIKNVHLSVYPPTGQVRISAPLHMSLETIRAFALSKLGWIKQAQQKLRAQERETRREYLERESLYCWGKRYLLRIEERERAPSVRLTSRTLVLHVRPGASPAVRGAVIDAWYRQELKRVAAPLVKKWQRRMGIETVQCTVRKMKTRWGSCTPTRRSIRLNLELAKKPPACLEYIIVHELAHLIEPSHNSRFTAVLDRFLPHWQQQRDELNRLPVRHEEWGY